MGLRYSSAGNFDWGVLIFPTGIWKPGNSWLEGLAPPFRDRPIAISNEFYPTTRLAWMVVSGFLCSRGAKSFYLDLLSVF